ncbi:unnamed protein product [Malus baccata var. baccata]
MGNSDKLDIRADKDVNIVDVTDEINVEEERVSYPIMSDRVKEVDGLNAEQGIGSDKDVDIVDISYEVNVEEEHVGSPTTSYHVKEVDGLNAEQSVGLDKDVDILDVADEINVAEESVSALTTSEHVQTELDGTAIRLQDSCQQMELMKSRAHKLDNCYVPQQESERGQLNSISPIHEGCYDNQRVTQVHSLPTHTRHLGTQQSLQGMLQPSPRAPIVHGCYEIRGNPEDMEQSVGSSRKHRRDKHPPK